VLQKLIIYAVKYEPKEFPWAVMNKALLRMFDNEAHVRIHVWTVTIRFMSRNRSKAKLTDKCLVVPDLNFLSVMHIHAIY
jgi:DNA-directed RNA polymerase subunit E'/Rpb7